MKVFCLFLVFWCLEKIWMSKKEKCWKEKSNLRKKCYKKKVEKRCLEKSVIKKSLLSVIKSVEKSKSVEKKSRIYFWNLFWIFEFWIFLCFLSLKESQKSLSRWKKLLKILKVFLREYENFFWWWCLLMMRIFLQFFWLWKVCEKWKKNIFTILAFNFFLAFLTFLTFFLQFFLTIFLYNFYNFFFFFSRVPLSPKCIIIYKWEVGLFFLIISLI